VGWVNCVEIAEGCNLQAGPYRRGWSSCGKTCCHSNFTAHIARPLTATVSACPPAAFLCCACGRRLLITTAPQALA